MVRRWGHRESNRSKALRFLGIGPLCSAPSAAVLCDLCDSGFVSKMLAWDHRRGSGDADREAHSFDTSHSLSSLAGPTMSPTISILSFIDPIQSPAFGEIG